MIHDLVTRNIFIDTSIFISLNYQHNKLFKTFISLTDKKSAFLYLTSITVEEVKSNIESSIHKAHKAYSKFQNEAKILRNLQHSPFREFFMDFDPEDGLRMLYTQFDDFIIEANAKILSNYSASVDALFNRYFNKMAPFGDSKKKSEFPDAFVLLTLENWCKENNDKMYVISSDTDMKTYCGSSDNLIHLEKLAQFLELITFHDEKLAPYVDKLLEDKQQEIKQAISKEFSYLGFWLEDQDGDVDDVAAQDVEILDESLIKVNENYAMVEFEVEVTFKADVTYDDYETAYYDSDYKERVPMQKISKNIDRNVEITAELTLNFDISNPDKFKIGQVNILNADSSNSIPVSIEKSYYK